jgi:hypothetical protein
MAGSLREVVAAARAAFQGPTALIAELIALRPQVAVLRRSGTRRPCFRVPDRLFWVLLSHWWSGWRESLIIAQPETVLRWRRQGFFSIWRYRSRGRWRGGRPRIPHEIRDLIAYSPISTHSRPGREPYRVSDATAHRPIGQFQSPMRRQ